MKDYIPNFTNTNIDKYVVKKKLGSGAYSKVWECEKDNMLYAVKITKCNIVDFKKEVKILKKIQHKNIIKLYDYYSLKIYPAKKFYCLITDKCDYDLYEVMDKISTIQIKNYMKDILQGLAYMHSLEIIHCDIKPENILIKDDTALIADFGLSEYTYTSDTYSRGTTYYKAPEMLCGITISEKIDIWALGCVLFELMTGQVLFNPKKYRNIDKITSKIDHIIQITSLLGPIPEYFMNGIRNSVLDYKIPDNMINTTNIDTKLKSYKINDSELKDLLENMLSINPNNRYTAHQCLQHSWFNKN